MGIKVFCFYLILLGFLLLAIYFFQGITYLAEFRHLEVNSKVLRKCALVTRSFKNLIQIKTITDASKWQ